MSFLGIYVLFGYTLWFMYRNWLIIFSGNLFGYRGLDVFFLRMENNLGLFIELVVMRVGSNRRGYLRRMRLFNYYFYY